MQELKIFENKEFGQVRIIDVNGVSMFVANDVARALGYSNPSKATNDHCKKAQMEWGNDSLGRRQEFKVIPESDLYRLITHSKLDSAERFENWVFEDVLPSIRKHGAYMTEETLERAITSPDFLIRIATELKKTRLEKEEAERKNAILMHVNKTYTVTEIAKELGLKSAIQLNKILADKKIQYQANGTWVMYSQYSDMGYEEIKQDVLYNGKVIYHRKITQLGREFILKLFGFDAE